MEQLYTTPEVSRETGIPEGTIRSWLSRYPGAFEIDKHIIIEEGTGRKLWTCEGVQLLKQRRATENESENAAAHVAGNDAMDAAILEQLLDGAAIPLAIAFYQNLPARVVQHIKRMRTNPTPQEQEMVQHSMQQAVTAGVFQLLPNSDTRRLAG